LYTGGPGRAVMRAEVTRRRSDRWQEERCGHRTPEHNQLVAGIKTDPFGWNYFAMAGIYCHARLATQNW